MIRIRIQILVCNWIRIKRIRILNTGFNCSSCVRANSRDVELLKAELEARAQHEEWSAIFDVL